MYAAELAVMKHVCQGVDYAELELRTLGQALLRPTSSSMRYEVLAHVGIDPSRADELAATYRLGGTAALAQAIAAQGNGS